MLGQNWITTLSFYFSFLFSFSFYFFFLFFFSYFFPTTQEPPSGNPLFLSALSLSLSFSPLLSVSVWCSHSALNVIHYHYLLSSISPLSSVLSRQFWCQSTPRETSFAVVPTILYETRQIFNTIPMKLNLSSQITAIRDQPQISNLLFVSFEKRYILNIFGEGCGTKLGTTVSSLGMFYKARPKGIWRRPELKILN